MRSDRLTLRWWVIGLATCAVVVASCGDDGPSAPMFSVTGVVEASPTCPVERPGEVCPPAPVQGKISFTRFDDDVLAMVSSDAQGRFTVQLPAGTYAVGVDTGQVFPTCPPTDVVVTDRAVELRVECDTGIR